MFGWNKNRPYIIKWCLLPVPVISQLNTVKAAAASSFFPQYARALWEPKHCAYECNWISELSDYSMFQHEVDLDWSVCCCSGVENDVLFVIWPDSVRVWTKRLRLQEKKKLITGNQLAWCVVLFFLFMFSVLFWFLFIDLCSGAIFHLKRFQNFF